MKTMATLLLLLAASAVATGQSGDAEKSKIIALENTWNLAEQQKDVKALGELVGSNLVYIDYDGSIQNKAQFLASVGSPSLHPEQIVNESTTVYMYGSAAVVTGTYREKGIEKGKPYLRRGRFTDTWVYANGAWQCVASQSTLISH
ncbi:MAG: nuclear transport factor 2 family protein [Terriglobales bacterium]